MQSQEENKRLQFDNQRLQERCGDFTQKLNELQKMIQDKDEEMAILNSDKVRFKELSENYMQEVARLEAQFEAADLKPQNIKANQRPKDTVTRDHKNSMTNFNSLKLKNVDAKQLVEVV